jgi:hypothetical protein
MAISCYKKFLWLIPLNDLKGLLEKYIANVKQTPNIIESLL